MGSLGKGEGDEDEKGGMEKKEGGGRGELKTEEPGSVGGLRESKKQEEGQEEGLGKANKGKKRPRRREEKRGEHEWRGRERG